MNTHSLMSLTIPNSLKSDTKISIKISKLGLRTFLNFSQFFTPNPKLDDEFMFRLMGYNQKGVRNHNPQIFSEILSKICLLPSSQSIFEVMNSNPWFWIFKFFPDAFFFANARLQSRTRWTKINWPKFLLRGCEAPHAIAEFNYQDLCERDPLLAHV